MTHENPQSTIMTILQKATGSDAELREQAIRRFSEIYRDPLVDFLRLSKRIPVDVAEDVVQSFWSERFLKPDNAVPFIERFLVRKKEFPAQSFRKYLARSISNHYISLIRKTKPIGQVEDLDEIAVDPAKFESDDQAFDRAWANHFFFRVLEAVRLECFTKNQELAWALFEDHLLSPALKDTPPPGYAELAGKFGLQNPKVAANLVQTVLRKFRRVIDEFTADYLPFDQEEGHSGGLRSEITDLFAVLCQKGNLCLQTALECDSAYSVGFALVLDGDHHRSLNYQFLRAHSLFDSNTDVTVAWNQTLDMPLSHWLLPNTAISMRLIDLVAGRDINLEFCDQIRSRAKLLGSSQNSDTRGELPSEFFATTYLLAIAASSTYLNRQLSTQPLEKLAQNCQKVLAHGWLDGKSRALLNHFAGISAKPNSQ
jgi:DNA-directed RNA polymerase specialized sigma24 family protein